jgi:hypothetical protein
VSRVQADQTAALGLDGTGQVVAVLDTGVDAAPEPGRQAVAEACFGRATPGSGDCPNGATTDTGPGSGIYCTYAEECFHGTHVAASRWATARSIPVWRAAPT